MALLFKGSQSWLTAPTSLLDGAATASLSIWFRVDPANAIADPGGVVLFGDLGGKLAVTLSGASTVAVAWQSHDGTAAGGSQHQFPTTSGTSHHLAATWQAGAQRYYLDGNLIHTDTKAGVIGPATASGPQRIRLGSSSPGGIVALDEPTVWVGHALTDDEVRDLRDRTVHPEGIAPGSIALQWSLGGPDGATSVAGDDGLADRSASQLNLVTIQGAAATYLGGVLGGTSQGPRAVATVCPSGKSVIIRAVGADGRPMAVDSTRSADEVQSIRLAAMPGGNVTLSFDGQATASIPLGVDGPPNYLEWSIPVVPQTSVKPSLAFIPFNGLTQALCVEIIDGSRIVRTLTLDSHAIPPDAFADGTTTTSGTPIRWSGTTAYRFSGASMKVRLSAAVGEWLAIGGLRVEAQDGTVRHFSSDYSDPQSNCVAYPINQYRWGLSENLAFGNNLGPRYADNNAFSAGAGSTIAIDPAGVQAALAALPNIGVGNVVASRHPSIAGQVLVEFTGALGNRAQPMLASNDPAIEITRNYPGGNYTTLSIAGRPDPVPLKKPIHLSGMDYIVYPLPQASPDAFVIGPGVRSFVLGGAGWNDASPSNRPDGSTAPIGASPTAGALQARWKFQALLSDSHQFAVTWPDTYSGPFGYQLSHNAVFRFEDGAGKPIGSPITVDLKVPPGDFQADGVGWKVLGTVATPASRDVTLTLTNGDGLAIVAEAAMARRVGPDTSVVVPPGAACTIGAPAGWIQVGGADMPAATGLAVANRSGLDRLVAPTPADAPGSLQVGWNIFPSSPIQPTPLLANLAVGGQYDPATVLAMDGNNYPTRCTVGTFDVTLAINTYDGGGNAKCVPQIPYGDYWLEWSGASNVSLTSFGPIATSNTRTSYQPTNKQWRRYTLAPTFYYGPSLNLRVVGTPIGDGTFAYDFRDVKVYALGMGIDPASPPRFNPAALELLAGTSIIRLMDSLSTIGGNIANYAELARPELFSSFMPTRFLPMPISQIKAITGPAPGYFCQDRGGSSMAVEVTTANPHGLATGQGVKFAGQDLVVRRSDGSTYDLASPGYIGDGLYDTYVISPVKFLAKLPAPSVGLSMTNTILGGSVVPRTGSDQMPFLDCIALCNAVGSDVLVNIPPAATDDCVVAMADALATGLAPGRKIYVEYSNEIWNTMFAIPHNVCVTMGAELGLYPTGLDSTPYQIYRSAQIFKIFAARLGRVGRSGDLVRTIASQFANVGQTTALAHEAVRQGVTFDRLLVAPYLHSMDGNVAVGANDPYAGVYDTLDRDQCVDLMEITIECNGYDTLLAAHSTAMSAAGLTGVKLACYEGGFEDTSPAGRTNDAPSMRQYVQRHPRAYWMLTRLLEKFQAVGCERFIYFNLNAAPNASFQWASTYGWNTGIGTGDPTLDTANLADPFNLPALKSEVVGAMTRWSKRAPQPVRKPRFLPSQLDGVRATGLGRRLRRPIR